MSEARIVWANDAASKAARHISEVRTGLSCNCVCAGCEARLEAVNAENPLWKRRPHFRHIQAPELEDCAQKAILTGAREMLMQAAEIALPEFRAKSVVAAQDKIEFSAEVTNLEQRVAVLAVELVDAADAILTLADGQQIYVRLVAKAKRPTDVKQTLLSEVLIDLSDPVLRTADPETLRQHITLGAGAKHWCSHLRKPDLLAEAEAAAQAKADKHWTDRIAQREADERARQHAEDLVAKRPPPFPNLVSSHPSQTWAPLHQKTVRAQTHIVAPVVSSKPRYSGPGDDVWAAEPPEPQLVRSLISTNKQIWSKWDWRAIMVFGEKARRRGVSVDDAITEALEYFRFSPSNNIVRNSWLQAGILRHIPRATEVSEEDHGISLRNGKLVR